MVYLEGYKVFLLYINKFSTSLGRTYFYFSRVLGGIIIVLEECYGVSISDDNI